MAQKKLEVDLKDILAFISQRQRLKMEEFFKESRVSWNSRRERGVKPLLEPLSSVKRFLYAWRRRRCRCGVTELWRSGPCSLAGLLGDHKTSVAFITLIRSIFS